MSTKSSGTVATPNGKENANPATRTSQRKRAKLNDTSGHVQPTAKSTIRQPKSGNGRLSQLMNMPMDVLMEIFGHLHPLDLLHLARTTKAFRRVLMHKSSIFAWKAARATVPGFLDCPPELSEPQWANLAFDAHCNFCLRPNIRFVDWILRIRICSDCARTLLTDCVDDDFEDDRRDELLSTIPTRIGKRGRPEVRIDEYELIKSQYLAIEDPDARDAFVLGRQQLIWRIEQHAKLCTAWVDAKALLRSDELDSLRASRHKAIVEKLVALGWGDEIDKIPDYDALTTHKLVKTPQLLTERIWKNISKPMVEYMEQMKTRRLARELKELHKQRRISATKLLRAYKISAAPFTAVMPEKLDFCAFAPIKETLDRPTDLSVESVDANSFLHLMPELGGLIEQWRETITAKFVKEFKTDIIRVRASNYDNARGRRKLGSSSIEDSDESILQHMKLASTVFKCLDCQYRFHTVDNSDLPENFLGTFSQLLLYSRQPPTCPFWFPRVLGHKCLTKPVPDIDGDTLTPNGLIWHRKNWSCRIIEVDQEASKVAKTVVEACGMNPRTATPDDMDEHDARLECLKCFFTGSGGSYHVVFGWRSAVKHQCERHPCRPAEWRKLSASETEMARVGEETWIATLPRCITPSNQMVWQCVHCLDGPLELSWRTLEGIHIHIQLQHNIESPQVNQDYVKDFAAPELYATPTLFEASISKLDG